MKISFMLVAIAVLLAKGEECMIPLLCDDTPAWSKITMGEKDEVCESEIKELEDDINHLYNLTSQIQNMLEILENENSTTPPISASGTSEKTTNSISTTTASGGSRENTTQEYSTVSTNQATSTVGLTTQAPGPLGTTLLGATSVAKTTEVESTTKGNCDFKYNITCFRVIVDWERHIEFNDAKTLCDGISWKLGNIYDVTNYESLKTYLRSIIAPGWSLVAVWTGMTVENKTAHLTSGDPVFFPDELWFPGYPVSDPVQKHLVLQVNKNPADDQGLVNINPNHNGYQAALCEP